MARADQPQLMVFSERRFQGDALSDPICCESMLSEQKDRADREHPSSDEGNE